MLSRSQTANGGLKYIHAFQILALQTICIYISYSYGPYLSKYVGFFFLLPSLFFFFPLLETVQA